MNEQNLKNSLICLLGLFLISLIAYTAVNIPNAIKQGKYIGQEIETKNTITVSAAGEVYAKPDLAITVFSVISEAKTVVEAMSQNTEKMNAIINFMKSQDIEDKDLKSISFNIYPRYEWQGRTGLPPYPQGKRVLVGYEVRQSLQVKIRDMEKIGKVIQGATDAGANQVGDLSFIIDKQDELKKQAREQAIEKAKTKANELASQLDVNLVRITNFSESGVIPRYYGLEKAVGMGIDEEELQIETGENKIEVTVNITFEIN
ncbi:SIMPL domain-containing protein [Candidatus Parcubacteria bacterium]|nr:SIMPL domain-containing protein [Candidatus Parcubacteria bacterium]